MPTLQFKGKNIIWNHHMSVPYHTLDPVKDLDFQPEKSNGNLIVEGDNLVALKALLPQYGGKVKCIAIDPPYNTGGENWIYNDNVNSPMINEWLGKVVNKDDLTRHDKWLCMMTPRLKVLHELLSEDGVIFINIDNNEYAHLQLLLNEIFGEENHVGTLIWRKKEGGGQADQFFVTEHEYVLVYQKTSLFEWFDEEYEVDADDFTAEDERGKYNLVKLAKWGNTARREDRPKSYFSIIDPDGKKNYPIAPDGNDGRWRVGKKRMQELIENELIAWKTKDDKYIPYEKVYYEEGMKKVIKERSILFDLANTATASKELTEIFGEKDIFDTPKPVDLIKFFLEYTTRKNSIVLDSFSGSGTTAHAVMKLNKEDEGNRQYIVVQMPENSEKEPDKNICRDITRERIVRAIDKYGYESGFEYVKVGQALDAETLLDGELPSYEIFAKYVYYLATGEHLEDDQNIDQESYFVGTKNNQDIYLIYDDNMDALQSLALNYEKAESFREKSGEKKIIVYAPACFLDEEDLEEMNIEFVSIPYNLFSKNQEV